tara:strand:- start:250 stop:1101 length:852 start_codon:yes stop_codon:yes gene_type:complete
MFSSFIIIAFNKIVLTIFSFSSVAFIMFCQSLFTCCVFLIRRVEIQKPGKEIAFLCFLTSANIFFSMLSTRTLNLAMFIALRRVSILTVMIAQYCFLNIELKKPIFWSVIAMVGGSLLAVVNDLTFDAKGYAYIMLNNILTTAVQIQTKKTLGKKWKKSTVIFWSSASTLMLSGVQLLSFNPKSFDAWDNTSFQIAFFFSIILGFFINYGTTWTIEKNDALTLSVANSAKSTIMGLLVCGGLFDPTYKFSWWNFTGLQISAAASFFYVYYRKQNSNQTLTDYT